MRRQNQTIQIEGLKDFPIEDFGLTKKSIRISNNNVMIPTELMPYLKLTRTPKDIRKLRAKYKREYEHRLKKSPKRECRA